MPSNQFDGRAQMTLDPPGLQLRSQATTASDTVTFEALGAMLNGLSRRR